MTTQEFEANLVKILSYIPEYYRSWLSSQIWEDFHAYGYDEILLHLGDYVDGLKKCLEERETTKSSHDHLTNGQRAKIRQQAIHATFNDAQQDDEYLMSLVEGWIDTMTVDDQAYAISGDEDMWPDLLDFDPRTGEKWDDS